MDLLHLLKEGLDQINISPLELNKKTLVNIFKIWILNAIQIHFIRTHFTKNFFYKILRVNQNINFELLYKPSLKKLKRFHFYYTIYPATIIWCLYSLGKDLSDALECCDRLYLLWWHRWTTPYTGSLICHSIKKS